MSLDNQHENVTSVINTLKSDLGSIESQIQTIETSRGHIFHIFNIGDVRDPVFINNDALEEILGLDFFDSIDVDTYCIVIGNNPDRSGAVQGTRIANLIHSNYPLTFADSKIAYIPRKDLTVANFLHELKHLSHNKRWREAHQLDLQKYNQALEYKDNHTKLTIAALFVFTQFIALALYIPESRTLFMKVAIPLIGLYIANYPKYYLNYRNDLREIEAHKAERIKLSTQIFV